MNTVVAIVIIALLFFGIRKWLPAKSDVGEEDHATPRAPSSPPWSLSRTSRGAEIQLPGSLSLSLDGEPSSIDSVMAFLNRTMGQRFPGRLGELAMLMSRLNVESPEVEAWRQKIVGQLQPKVTRATKALEKNEDYEGCDPEELMSDAAIDLLDEHSERPSEYVEWLDLVVDRPTALSDDDAFLAYVDHEPAALAALLGNTQRIGRAVRIEDERWREGWNRLVTCGAAVRGDRAPAEALVDAVTIKDLRAALPDGVKIRRKTDAIEHLDEAVRQHLPGLDRVYYLKPLTDEISRGLMPFRWALTHSRLLLETLVCAERCAAALEQPRQQGDMYEIYGDCCTRSRKASERDPATRKPKALPPFHIACTAEVEVHQFD